MLFNSLTFLCFFLAVLAGYWLARTRNMQLNWLLCGSVLFYSTWSWLYALIFLGLISLNYAATLVLHRGRSRALLAAVIAFDLGFLCWHKYAYFVFENGVRLCGMAGIAEPPWRLPEIVLPLGISFYTFQLIACVVDIFKGHAPLKSWRDFTLFVVFFPHQLAGPIFRIDELAPQFDLHPKLRDVRWREAFWWICLGLCKKVLIADYLAAMADAAFGNPEKVKSLTTLFAVHAFTFQIYCDFSGYSNIARGLGLLMGFDLIHNFNMPYVSKNMREFWQRWHISLSRWLRDYLYIPLGGNRGGLGMTCRNLMLTMGLGGLWHGASWTFVLWGCYHGALLMGERLWDRFSRWKPRIPGWIAVLAIYHLAALGWIFFRTHTMHDLQLVFRNLGEDWEDLDRLRSWRGLWERNADALIALGVAIAGQIVASRVPPQRFWNMPAWALGLLVAFVVTVLTILAPGNREFIYFQF